MGAQPGPRGRGPWRPRAHRGGHRARTRPDRRAAGGRRRPGGDPERAPGGDRARGRARRAAGGRLRHRQRGLRRARGGRADAQAVPGRDLRPGHGARTACRAAAGAAVRGRRRHPGHAAGLAGGRLPGRRHRRRAVPGRAAGRAHARTGAPLPQCMDGPPRMKITRLSTWHAAPRWLFLRIDTDEGISGWGEPVIEGRADTVEAAVRELGDYLVGRDPARINDLWQVLYRGGFYRGGAILMSAIAGIDQALWDIKGKALGVPVYQLLGGLVRDRIKTYRWVGGDRPADIVAQMQAYRAQGFDTFKFNGTGELKLID